VAVAQPGLEQSLKELGRLARASKRRAPRPGDAAGLLARVLCGARTLGIEQRAGGMAFRLEAADAGVRCQLTCVIHEAEDETPLTGSEREVAERLCEGRTLAQIARLRGVSINTVKSQVRQIFRKLDVNSRVALVRRLCP
jgi:DNA-binding CsgD family transcriptional regulator